jgi:oxalyl-CoA decarboxylase
MSEWRNDNDTTVNNTWSGSVQWVGFAAELKAADYTLAELKTAAFTATQLKAVGRAGVGVDNVDVEAATKKGVIVMNTPGGNTVSTAEHTFSLMMAISRNIAQADASVRALVERSGIPYLPMSMAKGLLPDTHAQCASAARSHVLAEADVVVLIGARLNWLLSHGKGKTWGGSTTRRFIQIDIAPTEMDSNVPIAAPLVGDVGSCVDALLAGMGSNWAAPPAEWTRAVFDKRDKNQAKMAETLAKNPSPMNFQSALSAVRDVIRENPEAILVNEGANTLDFTRSIVDMYLPRKRLDVGTWGIMGIGMGFSVAAAVVTGKPVIAVEGDSAFGFSAMEVETICRYHLPVCVVVFNNNGVYRGTDVNGSGGADVAPTVFVKGARYEMMMQAFGGVGVVAATPAELGAAMREAVASGKPTLINAIIDETAGTESGRITMLNPQTAKK